MRRPNRRKRRGFTLLEVLLVLAILVILGGMVGVFIAQAQTNAYRDIAKTQIEAFEGMLELYRMNVGTYPTPSSGLKALQAAPSDLTNPNKWRGPYIDEEIPLDPWGNEYQYDLVKSPSGQTRIRIWSFGPDGVDGSGDEIDGDSTS